MYAVNRKTGARIKGTYEQVTGCALTIDDSYERDEKGEVIYDHDGETEVYWDGQITLRRPDGKTIFLDADGDEVHEDDILLFESDEELDGYTGDESYEMQNTATVEGHGDLLLQALKDVVKSAVPNPKEHPAMFAAWQKAEALIKKLED